MYVFNDISAQVDYKSAYDTPKKIEASQAFAKAISEIEDAKEAFERFKGSYATASPSDKAVQEALDAAKAGP